MNKKDRPKPGKPGTHGRRKRDEFGSSSDEFRERETAKKIADWIPKTDLGKKVKNGEVASLDYLFDHSLKVLEPEIIDVLLPNAMEKMIEFKKTARVVRSGRQFSYRATVLVGNAHGFVGIGTASDRERVPALAKAARRAKLNLVRVYRGCGSWECICGLGHSIPFAMSGKCGSVKIRLMPAPKGIGLVVGEHLKDVLRFAGISDVWSISKGRSRTSLNFVKSCVNALERGTRMRMSKEIENKIAKLETKALGVDKHDAGSDSD